MHSWADLRAVVTAGAPPESRAQNVEDGSRTAGISVQDG